MSVAQLVERWLVVPEVAGSIPVIHPNFFLGDIMEWRCCKTNPPKVEGSYVVYFPVFGSMRTLAYHIEDKRWGPESNQHPYEQPSCWAEKPDVPDFFRNVSKE